MVFLFSLLVLLNPLAEASLQKISIKNLDLDYVSPRGAGTFEKLQIGINFDEPVYPLEVIKQDDRFELVTPFVDFHWLNPAKFVHSMQTIGTQDLDASLGSKEHQVKALNLKFTPENMGEFGLDELFIACSGESVKARFEDRLVEDCLKNLTVEIKKVNVPPSAPKPEFLPLIKEYEMGLPVSDFNLKVAEGDFNLGVKIKYYLKARIYAWGNVSLNEDRTELSIRVDRVKYGFLPITPLVMKTLKEKIKSPNIEVTPTHIKIKLGSKE